jgi:uncharacterized protein (TIGR03437 family)
LVVNTTPLNFTAPSGGGIQAGFVTVNNKGGGHMIWGTRITYTNGSGWLQLFPPDGVDNATIRVDALPGKLTPGTYQAILTVDAGPIVGSANVPITFVVTAPQATPPVPTINHVLNAANFAEGPVVPGSLASLFGSHLSGTNLLVTFDGINAKVLFSNDTQINLIVPAELAKKPSSQMIVVVDGIASVAQTVSLADFSPAIFTNGVLNQDNTVNGAVHPAGAGTILQIFATGLSGNGEISARINGSTVTSLKFAGPAPGIPGVQQVNLQLPSGLTAASVQVSVCGGLPGKADQATCSPAVQVALAP